MISVQEESLRWGQCAEHHWLLLESRVLFLVSDPFHTSCISSLYHSFILLFFLRTIRFWAREVKGHFRIMRLLKSNQRRRSVIVQAMLYFALYLTIKLGNGSKASCQALLSICVFCDWQVCVCRWRRPGAHMECWGEQNITLWICSLHVNDMVNLAQIGQKLA